KNAGELEFDFVVRSTARPEPIHFRFDNAASLEIEKAGDLKIHGLDSLLTIRRPSAYQLVNGARREIETGFDLTGRLDAVLRISKYDSSVPLIIDPVFTYSTYLGGSRRDTPDAIAVDTQGNSYIAGQTFSGDFLLKSPMQALRGTSDAFIAKFAPDGKLLYSTFIGGEGDDEAKAVSVDMLGNVYIAGSTFSQGFPIMAPKPT